MAWAWRQGYSLNLTRTIPQCVVTFVAYEWLSTLLQDRLRSARTEERKDSSYSLVRTRSEAR